MKKHSKFKDIQAVIKKAEKMLPNIEEQYHNCLKEENIPDNLLVDIKDYLANLRTALDYLWHKIPSVSGGNFPVANSKADFDNKTNSIEEKYAQILENFQDYDSDSWIRCFNLFRNKNVHITLVPQKRVETPALNIQHNGVGLKLTGGASIQMEAGTSMSLGGATITGGQTISANSDGLIGDPRLKVRKEIWVDFVFDGSSISPDFPERVSALPFLKKSLGQVNQVITELEKEL